MKTMSRLKKVVALGMGLSMVGATLFGASAASLGDYPAPFVKDGVPASNLAVVVGDNAAASDVVGMGDIVAGLQASAVSKQSVPGAGASRVTLKGDSVEFGSPTDLLELNESIGSVRESISEFDLSILKGGSISTQRGVTKYNQYLQFNSSAAARSLKVVFTEDEFDNVGDVLFVRDQDALFDWVLEFEEGFISDTTVSSIGKDLKDLQDRTLNVLGTEYAVVKASFVAPSNHTTRYSEFRLELLGGPVYDELGEGDKKTYTLNGKEYEVEIVVISETNNEVLLKVNGALLPKMKRAELEPTSDGTLLALRDIISTGKDTQSSVVRLYLGATKLVFRDVNVTDQAYTKGGAVVNNEIIEDADVRIRGGITKSATDISSVTFNDVRYRLNSDALVGHMYIPPGHGVREYLDEPEGMLAPNWDITYQGLTDTGVTNVKLHAVARDEYKLEFTTQEGLNYVVPAFTVRRNGSSGPIVRLGEVSGSRHRMLWTREPNNRVYFPILQEDYFVLSDLEHPQSSAGQLAANGAARTPGNFGCIAPRQTPGGSYSSLSDNTAFTHVLKYQSGLNSSGVQQLTFNDLATGTKQVTWVAGSASGNKGNFTLIVGGNNYVGTANITGQNIPNIAVDLDANQTISQGTSRLLGTSWMLAEGGLVISINSTTELTVGATNQPGGTGWRVPHNGVRNATGTLTGGGAGTMGRTACITFTTIAKQFDEGRVSPGLTGQLNVSVPILQRSGDTIGMNLSAFAPSATDYVPYQFGLHESGLIPLTSTPENKQSRDLYGGLWEFFDPFTSDTPEELTYEYPLSQRGVQVFLTAGETTVEKSAGASADKLNKLPAGVSKLASEVSDIEAWNAVVVGGPCANEWSDSLMGSPEPCHESVPQGKALVKLYEHANGNVALLVAGRDAADTRRGSRALQTGELAKAGSAKSAEVTGSSLTDVTVRAA